MRRCAPAGLPASSRWRRRCQPVRDGAWGWKEDRARQVRQLQGGVASRWLRKKKKRPHCSRLAKNGLQCRTPLSGGALKCERRTHASCGCSVCCPAVVGRCMALRKRCAMLVAVHKRVAPRALFTERRRGAPGRCGASPSNRANGKKSCIAMRDAGAWLHAMAAPESCNAPAACGPTLGVCFPPAAPRPHWPCPPKTPARRSIKRETSWRSG